ncbi:MAG: hypothetical protein U9Q97_06295 [Acidobacteriota bacterium]|nr:hypothetical protein [Acidobacteriota bacterium]
MSMLYDEKPIYRKLIIPWFDSEATCFVVMFLMLVVALFALTGLYVACEKIEHQEYIWVPSLLVLMSTWVFISTSIRLIRRYKHHSTKYFVSKT